MKASDAVALVLARNNVLCGYELIGGMITQLVDSINQLGKTKLISGHNEQGAAFAASAVAQETHHEVLGAALGTSGPGATNLMTGIADCWLDSHHCLFLKGQVNTYELKGERRIRQQGFQELDSVALASSITKYAYQVKQVESPGQLEALDLPYVARLKGAKKIRESANYSGMLGAYVTRAANHAVQNCDFLPLLGSRLDVRQTGAKPDDFARKAKIIQIDLMEGQLNNRVQTHAS